VLLKKAAEKAVPVAIKKDLVSGHNWNFVPDQNRHQF
jgi:hypothetical protein